LRGELTPHTIKSQARRLQVLAVIHKLKLYDFIPDDQIFKLPSGSDVKRTNKKTRIQSRYISQADFERFLVALPNTPKGQQLALVSQLGYDSGLRLEEAVSLTPEKMKILPNGRVILEIYGKGDHVREVPVKQDIARTLQQVLPFHVTYNYVKCTTIRIFQKLGIRASFHDFRHTAATNFANMDIPSRTIQKILGHNNLATTEIYIDLVHVDGARHQAFQEWK
jgi:integrase